jgi:hypothetical protein
MCINIDASVLIVNDLLKKKKKYDGAAFQSGEKMLNKKLLCCFERFLLNFFSII